MAQNDIQTSKDISELLTLSAEAQQRTGEYLKQIDRTLNGVGGEVVKANKAVEKVEGETKRYERAIETFRIQQDKLVDANDGIKNGLKKVHGGTNDVKDMLDSTKDIMDANQKSNNEQQEKILKSIEDSHNSSSAKMAELNKLLSDTDVHIRDLDKQKELEGIKAKIAEVTKAAKDYDETNEKRTNELMSKLDDTDLKLTNAISQVSALVSEANDMDNHFTSLLSTVGKIAVQVDGLTKGQPLAEHAEIELTNKEDAKDAKDAKDESAKDESAKDAKDESAKDEHQVTVNENGDKDKNGHTNHKQNKKNNKR